MADAKRQIRAILDRLPDDCTAEDVQYHLYVIEKIRRRLEAADDEKQLVSQSEVEARLEKWLVK